MYMSNHTLNLNHIILHPAIDFWVNDNNLFLNSVTPALMQHWDTPRGRSLKITMIPKSDFSFLYLYIIMFNLIEYGIVRHLTVVRIHSSKEGILPTPR